MDVILLERVEKLGSIGDVVKVKDGFARNFLLPNKKALRANEANRKVFEANRERLEAENASRRTDAEKEAKGLEGTSLTLIRQSSNTGQLYGSVAVRDIVEALEADGHKIAKSQVVLDRPIKAIGVHEVKVALHPEVAVTIKVNVARSPEEAEMQAEGVDVMAAMFEEGRDVAGFVEDYKVTEDAAAVLGEAPAEADATEEAEAGESAEG
ncbi:50S ribosomal protein L9 [Hephaestia mangrovi]|uniref:50S ribosomal protein L9 n=1 Tax=Hephaestia mangrovi TaxID=2873268 RepID=UPI001CA6ADFB|nr:50S ribosomal protein L9 [Hephaestia mangrovi]MBY8827763.1 50S ribosomal protein L9 [Hephaestia mangrovi]